MSEQPKMTAPRGAVALLVAALLGLALLLAQPASAAITPTSGASGSSATVDEQPATDIVERSRRPSESVRQDHAPAPAVASAPGPELALPTSGPAAGPAGAGAGPGPPRGPPAPR
jgi:hypothetical protein